MQTARVRGVKRIQGYNNKGQSKIKGQLFEVLVGKYCLIDSQLSGMQGITKREPEELANQKREGEGEWERGGKKEGERAID